MVHVELLRKQISISNLHMATHKKRSRLKLAGFADTNAFEQFRSTSDQLFTSFGLV